MPKISKTNAGYVFFEGTEYVCAECYKWMNRHFPLTCAEVEGKIAGFGGCNTFVPGKVEFEVGPPVAEKLTKISAGYAENKPGFSCKRCEYFDPENWDCSKVDKESDGPAKGVIHPNGCCNFWEKDEVRGVF